MYMPVILALGGQDGRVEVQGQTGLCSIQKRERERENANFTDAVDAKWCVNMVFICISLVANDVSIFSCVCWLYIFFGDMSI